MKKFSVLLLLLAVLIGLSACRSTVPAQGTATDTGTPDTGATDTPPEDPAVSEAASLLELKQTLRFKEDGSFRVLVFSDVHAFEDLARNTVRAIEAVVKVEQPDLVIFNGDLNWDPETEQIVRDNVTDMTKYLEKNGIPWAHTFGNHDSSSDSCVTREQQEAIYESFPYCVSKAGDPDVWGVGNYVLPILRSDSDQIAFNVWALDSGDYVDRMMPGLGVLENDDAYAFVSASQIDWYTRTSRLLEEYNGAKIPGMMALHIPLCEYNVVAENPEKTGMTGTVSETVCCSEVNSGLFAAALQRGDVKLFVAGHDHTNDFAGTYCGITLAYDATIGFQMYNKLETMGARVIDIHQDDPWHFTTRMSYLKDTPDWK